MAPWVHTTRGVGTTVACHREISYCRSPLEDAHAVPCASMHRCRMPCCAGCLPQLGPRLPPHPAWASRLGHGQRAHSRIMTERGTTSGCAATTECCEMMYTYYSGTGACTPCGELRADPHVTPPCDSPFGPPWGPALPLPLPLPWPQDSVASLHRNASVHSLTGTR